MQDHKISAETLQLVFENPRGQTQQH